MLMMDVQVRGVASSSDAQDSLNLDLKSKRVNIWSLFKAVMETSPSLGAIERRSESKYYLSGGRSILVIHNDVP